MSTRCAHRFANQYKPLLVNCCIFMIPATVKSIDIPPHLIRPVLLCFVSNDSIKMAVFPADNTPVISADCYSSLFRDERLWNTASPMTSRHYHWSVEDCSVWPAAEWLESSRRATPLRGCVRRPLLTVRIDGVLAEQWAGDARDDARGVEGWLGGMAAAEEAAEAAAEALIGGERRGGSVKDQKSWSLSGPNRDQDLQTLKH